ncbi:MAG TPA: sulfatase [Isosphaeraceae bacterium]|nr:sulfatase [Isosphaeraceae bacterium]
MSLSDDPLAAARTVRTATTRPRLSPWDVLVLSAWIGLAAGLCEVGVRVLCRSLDPTRRLYTMSRHFLWLAPLTDLLVFSAAGLVLALVTKRWPRRGAWLGPRLILFGAVLPALLVAGPRVYAAAWSILALGIATFAAPALERDAPALRRRLLVSFPVLLAVVLVLAGLRLGADGLKLWREAGRPRPPADAPNVLLIVLDTVRADHLSLYGYERATTPALERLARRGIRFDQARATAPWTLPCHASLFTGRWPHELAVEWLTPLRRDFPTLAEYLGTHGYATAGFVANTLYCSYDTGLDRGFTHYEDYVLERLSAFRTAYLGNLALETLAELVRAAIWYSGVRPASSGPPAWLQPLLIAERKKDAAAVNREFTAWLSQRQQPDRPFFVFLNYFDAHSPYLLPRGAVYRFGLTPRTADDLLVFEQWAEIDKLRLPPHFLSLARDSYDNCVAYLDERLGELFDELERRGLLDRTLVIVTADHGEGLGEHGLFFHGESLYRTEIRVPLVIVPPSQDRSRVVSEVISLRDVPATVADLVGLGDGSPFPGRSLARLWRDPNPAAGAGADALVISELESPNPFNPNQGRSPAHRGPLISLAEGDFVYIRNQGDATEELFNQRDDPRELLNRARANAMQPVLKQFRDRLNQLPTDFTRTP